jgi:hypothetical protein
VRLEGLGQLKNPVTSSAFETVTFRLVALCLNQLRYRVLHKKLQCKTEEDFAAVTGLSDIGAVKCAEEDNVASQRMRNFTLKNHECHCVMLLFSNFR